MRVSCISAGMAIFHTPCHGTRERCKLKRSHASVPRGYSTAAHAFPFDDGRQPFFHLCGFCRVCCVPTSKVLPSSSALVRPYLTV